MPVQCPWSLCIADEEGDEGGAPPLPPGRTVAARHTCAQWFWGNSLNDKSIERKSCRSLMVALNVPPLVVDKRLDPRLCCFICRCMISMIGICIRRKDHYF